ncbi:MAG TPA: biotin/lipoyl-containing protein, partial [Steroidobacteraceae bacterium]
AIGEAVTRDEPLLELETDKVTVEIPSPASGQLAEILKQLDEEVSPGELLARVRITVARAADGAAAAGGDEATRVPVAGAATALLQRPVMTRRVPWVTLCASAVTLRQPTLRSRS